jgi:MtN3 and saliva related transmembrane protein
MNALPAMKSFGSMTALSAHQLYAFRRIFIASGILHKMENIVLSTAATIVGMMMSIGHFPQAYKIWKRKSAKDISLITASIFAVGDWIWLAYGISIMAWPVIISFSIGVVAASSVLILALKYR